MPDIFTFDITEENRLLQTGPNRKEIGSQYDHMAQQLRFLRPFGREDDDLIMYILMSGTTHRINLGQENTFVITNAYTQVLSWEFQVAFVHEGIEIEHSSTATIAFRPSLSGAHVPPEDVDDFLAEVEENAHWGAITEDDGYLVFRNSKGEEVARVAAGGGGGTSNYNSLSNKPAINGVMLSGDKTAAELSLLAEETDPVFAAALPGLAAKEDVTAEAGERQASDAALGARVDSLTTRVADAEESVVAAAGTATDALTTANAAQAGVGQAQEGLAAETQARVDGDNALGVRVDHLTSRVEGMQASYTFDTEADMRAALADPEFVAKLQPGNNLYIRDVDAPDYWWDGEAAQVLEDEKVDLTGYYNREETDALLAGKVNDTDPRLSDARPASDVSAWAKAATKPAYTRGEVGLGNVDDTADMDKPVSTAQAAYIDGIVGDIEALLAAI